MKRKTSKVLSYVLSACMVFGIFANLPILKASADTAGTTNLITNGTFDTGNTAPWAPRGPVTLTATTEDSASGTHSLKVTGRTSTWNGPSIDLKTVLKKDITYNISLKVKVVSGQATAGAENTEQKVTVSMLRKETGAAADSYDTVAWQQTVNEETWKEISGTYKPQFDSYSTLTLYVESPNATLQFYVDDVLVVDPNATTSPDNSANLALNPSFEDGTAGAWFARQGENGTMVVAATNETSATGTYSLKVTGRRQDWNGPAYSVKNIMQNGKSYNVSMKVKAVAGQAEQGLVENVKLSIERQIDGSPTYTNLSQTISINETTWTTVSGKYSLNYTGELTLLDIYLESATANLAFYVDDVEIIDTTPVNTGNVVTNSTFENGTTGWAPSGPVTLAAVNNAAHSGNYSLKASDRGENWAGPSYDLTGKVVKEKSYNVDLWVMYNDEAAAATEVIKATFNPGYVTIGQVTANKGQWTKITGSISIPADFDSFSFYVEADNKDLSFYVDDVTVVGELPIKPLEIQQDIPDLADIFESYFKVGGAVNPGDLGSNSLTEQLIKKHYNIIVAENAMKPDATQPTEGNFTFTQGDKLVDFAIANGMEMRGHTLVWHSQVPDWFFQDPTDPTKNASKELLLQREKTHITKVLNHYKEKYGANNPIKWWDVVNEVIDDNGTYRNSKWYQIAGLDFIKVAFETAREVDPSLKLYINDYNIERNNAKTQKLYELVRDLKAEGVPIDGVGLQMHVSSDVSLDDVKASIEKYASLGVDIQITELDVKMGVENEAVTAEVLLQQARYYKQLFDIFKAHKVDISTVVLWGVIDDTSWINTYKPLLFDGKFQAKPAFYSIADLNNAIVNRQRTQATQGTPANINDISWTTVRSISVNNFVQELSGATARVQTMWDSQNLYIKANVSDATIGERDSIEFFIDINNGKTTTYEADDQHIEIKRSEGISAAGGYTVYKTIPLSSITPALGTTIGFDVRVNDDKGSGSITSIAVFNDYANRQNVNTSYFADLSFGGPSKIAEVVYGKPTVDGTKEALWSSANEISTNVWVIGTSGATAKVRTMWDEHNLYVIAEVTDDVLNKTNTNPWEQDSVEIFVDQNNAKTTSYQGDDSQIRVNFDNEESFGGRRPEGFESATSRTSTGYIVEMVIPFNAVTPAAGKIIGFDAQVNNANASGARVSVATWCDPSGNSYADTSGLGNLKLVGGPSNGGETPTTPTEPTTPTIPETASTTNSNTAVVISVLNSVSSNGKVVVDVSADKSVAKEIFDAIKGTDRTVTFKQDGIEWSFNGKDITADTKTVDMTVKVAPITNSTTANRSAIAEKVNNENVMVISFANNGQLPGKAKVKVKLDAAWLAGKNKNNINIYYYNETTKAIETIASALVVDSEGYVQFDITHNSDYIVSDKDLAKLTTPTPEQPKTAAVVERLSGANRYETSVKVAQAGWKVSDNVVLARGDDFADALSAAPFAKQLNAPVLLTSTKALDASVVAELKRLNAKKVYIIGGTGAISAAIENAVKAMGITVERISGSDRYATSLAVAKKMTNKSQVFLATGTSYADALSISSYAAATGSPILLTAKNQMTAEVAKFIKDNNSKVYVIGGTGVISEAAVKGIAGAERVAGADRYATNLAILNKFAAGYDFANIYLATGENYPDAICGSALAAKEKAPIILVNSTSTETQNNYIKSIIEKVKKVSVLGGTGVISEDTVKKIIN